MGRNILERSGGGTEGILIQDAEKIDQIIRGARARGASVLINAISTERGVRIEWSTLGSGSPISSGLGRKTRIKFGGRRVIKR